MIYIRSLISNIFFYSAVALMCITLCVLFFLPQKYLVRICNNFFIPLYIIILKYIGGISIEVRGKEHIRQDGVIYAIKHQSALETYVFTSIVKRGVFILKKELTYIPIFGWAQALYGMININRSSGGAAMKRMLKEAKDAIKNSRPILICPEGTRTKPGTKTMYKPGLLFIVDSLKVPVIPVALNTGLFWEKNSFLRHKGTVVIEFLEPMPNNLDKKTFMSELEGRIENKCKELNEEAIKKYPDAKKIYDKYREKI